MVQFMVVLLWMAGLAAAWEATMRLEEVHVDNRVMRYTVLDVSPPEGACVHWDVPKVDVETSGVYPERQVVPTACLVSVHCPNGQEYACGQEPHSLFRVDVAESSVAQHTLASLLLSTDSKGAYSFGLVASSFIDVSQCHLHLHPMTEQGMHGAFVQCSDRMKRVCASVSIQLNVLAHSPQSLYCTHTWSSTHDTHEVESLPPYRTASEWNTGAEHSRPRCFCAIFVC